MTGVQGDTLTGGAAGTVKEGVGHCDRIHCRGAVWAIGRENLRYWESFLIIGSKWSNWEHWE